jgi:ribosomal subunit interface protein
MEITIESPQIFVSLKFRDKIKIKLMHATRMYNRIVSCEVLLKKEKNDDKKDFFIEAKILVPKNLLFASGKAESFETALDKLTTNIKHQLYRHKERLQEM